MNNIIETVLKEYLKEIVEPAMFKYDFDKKKAKQYIINKYFSTIIDEVIELEYPSK